MLFTVASHYAQTPLTSLPPSDGIEYKLLASLLFLPPSLVSGLSVANNRTRYSFCSASLLHRSGTTLYAPNRDVMEWRQRLLNSATESLAPTAICGRQSGTGLTMPFHSSELCPRSNHSRYLPGPKGPSRWYFSAYQDSIKKNNSTGTN